jgi:predicted enzyme related to lactoylglutathione lyase
MSVPGLLVNIDIPDLEKAGRFYCAALGLRPGRRFAGALELLGSTTPIYLLAKHAGTQAASTTSAKRNYARHWTPVHLDFVVSDLSAAVAKAVAAGAVLEQPAARRKWGSIALLADPFGNGFCLLQFHGRGYDEIAQ